MIGLIWRERSIGRQQCLPLTLAAEAIEEKFDRFAGKHGISLEVIELMSTRVFESLLLDHCRRNGRGGHIFSCDRVLGLAHLDYSEQMCLAASAPHVVDNILAGEPAVNEKIIEVHLVYGCPVQHYLHIGYLVLKVLRLAPFHIRFIFAFLAEAGFTILLGQPLRTGRDTAFLSLKSKVNKQLGASISPAQEQSLVPEDAATIVNVREDSSEHLAFAACFRHICIIDNHADRLTGVSGVSADRDAGDEFFVDITHDMSPINTVIRKNPIEHVLPAIKEALQGAATITRHILDGEERKENQHLDDLTTGKLAVGFLFESHLPFCDVYGLKNAHYPLYTESATTFCVKIAQLRNDLPIFVYDRSIFLFGNTNMLKINEIIKYSRVFILVFFIFNYLRNSN